MRLRITTFILLLAAGVAGVALMLERQRGAVLREQRSLLRANERELATVRADTVRLQASLPSESELARLRSDHAAAVRLQAELNALRRQISVAEAAASGTQPK